MPRAIIFAIAARRTPPLLMIFAATRHAVLMPLPPPLIISRHLPALLPLLMPMTLPPHAAAAAFDFFFRRYVMLPPCRHAVDDDAGRRRHMAAFRRCFAYFRRAALPPSLCRDTLTLTAPLMLPCLRHCEMLLHDIITLMPPPLLPRYCAFDISLMIFAMPPLLSPLMSHTCRCFRHAAGACCPPRPLDMPPPVTPFERIMIARAQRASAQRFACCCLMLRR